MFLYFCRELRKENKLTLTESKHLENEDAKSLDLLIESKEKELMTELIGSMQAQGISGLLGKTAADTMKATSSLAKGVKAVLGLAKQIVKKSIVIMLPFLDEGDLSSFKSFFNAINQELRLNLPDSFSHTTSVGQFVGDAAIALAASPVGYFAHSLSSGQQDRNKVAKFMAANIDRYASSNKSAKDIKNILVSGGYINEDFSDPILNSDFLLSESIVLNEARVSIKQLVDSCGEFARSPSYQKFLVSNEIAGLRKSIKDSVSENTEEAIKIIKSIKSAQKIEDVKLSSAKNMMLSIANQIKENLQKQAEQLQKQGEVSVQIQESGMFEYAKYAACYIVVSTVVAKIHRISSIMSKPEEGKISVNGVSLSDFDAAGTSSFKKMMDSVNNAVQLGISVDKASNNSNHAKMTQAALQKIEPDLSVDRMKKLEQDVEQFITVTPAQAPEGESPPEDTTTDAESSSASADAEEKK